MKEPGQMLCDLYCYPAYSERLYCFPAHWEQLEQWQRDNLARIEAAIRADESAKVRAATIEECAKVAEDQSYGFPPEDLTEHGVGYDRACKEIAASIRALPDY